MSNSTDLPSSEAFVDLHAHTNESDGTFTPEQLVSLADRIGLRALAITDHDTLSGYRKALPFAHAAGLDLVCGIELNTRMTAEASLSVRSVHLLAYFVAGEPAENLLTWLENERSERRSRNQRLVARLQGNGIDITLEEVEARGRSLAGRPHFARILVEKGYARTYDEAFKKYLGEDAPSFVPRESQTTEQTIAIVRSAGGVPVVAHPVRLGLPRPQERELLIRYRGAGLLGLEIYHSEHTPELQAYYHQLASELELLPTGGSDFHGAIKPEVQLGTGMNGNIRVPAAFLEALRHAAR